MSDMKGAVVIEMSDLDNIGVLKDKDLIGEELKLKVQHIFNGVYNFLCVNLDNKVVFSCNGFY